MIYFKKLFFLLLFLISGYVAWSQDRPVLFASTLYDKSGGLSRGYINDIVRDSHGYFWLATERGVIRFDGGNFLPARLLNSEFENLQIKKLRIHKDALYLLFETAPMVKLSLKDFSSTVVSREPILDMHVLSDSELIQIGKSGWLKKISDGKTVDSAQYEMTSNIDALLQPWQGKLIFHRGGKGMLVLDPENLKVLRNLGLGRCTNFMSFDQLDDGSLAFNSDGDIYRIDRLFNVEEYFKISGLPEGEIKELRTDGTDVIYFGVQQKIFRLAKGVSEEIPLAGLNNAELRKIFVVDHQNILLGTNMGLVHIREKKEAVQRLEPVLEVDERTLFVHRRVIQLPNHEVAFFGTPGMMIRDRVGTLKILPEISGDAFDAVHLKDFIFISTHGNGLIQFDLVKKTAERILPPPADTDSAFYGIGVRADVGELLVGMRGSYKILSADTRKRETFSIPNKSAAVREFYFDAERNGYWIGTDSGLYHTPASMFKPVLFGNKKDFLTGKQISGLIRGKGNLLWVSHDRGLQAIDLKQLKVVKKLESSEFVNPRIAAMLMDRHGRLWMSTYSGIVGYDPETDRMLKPDISLLINDEYNYKSAAVLDDGRLIFGGLRGYDIIDPEQFNFSLTGVSGRYSGFEKVSASNRSFFALDSVAPVIDFNVRNETVRIHLASVEALQSDTYRYEYSLNGGAWLPVNGRNYIDIYSLEPGSYNLRVRATDRLGGSILFPEAVVRAHVPFYQEKAFLWLLMGLLIVSLSSIGWIRWSSWKKELALKENISMDLHDEIGTILTRALLVASSGNAAVRQTSVREYLSEALFGLRAYINTMNKLSFSSKELSVDLNELLETILKPFQLDYQFSSEENAPLVIPGELYRDIKLCYYEAVNNALKHSGASKVLVKFETASGSLTLNISDNGSYRDGQLLQGKGNGMLNLQKRVRRHKGRLSFSAVDGGGLAVSICFPGLRQV